MDYELADSTIGQSFEKMNISNSNDDVSTPQQQTTSNENDNQYRKVDLNLNLVKNLLESLKEQHGLSGPASNILKEMIDSNK
eukprot:gene3102-3880_t